MTKCPKCGDSVKKTKIDYDIDEEKIIVHDVPALKCSSCDYITMSSDGKSLILRIPKDIATALNLSSKDEVEIWVDGQRVIVEKASA